MHNFYLAFFEDDRFFWISISRWGGLQVISPWTYFIKLPLRVKSFAIGLESSTRDLSLHSNRLSLFLNSLHLQLEKLLLEIIELLGLFATQL